MDTILGANAHVTVYQTGVVSETGKIDRTIRDYDVMAKQLRTGPGVTRAAPLIKGQVMANLRSRNSGVEVFGMRAENLADADVVVISSAIKRGNPELDEARARGLPVVRRAEPAA